MAACERCWDEAFFRSRLTGRSQADVYHELLAENEGKPGHTDTTDTERTI